MPNGNRKKEYNPPHMYETSFHDGRMLTETDNGFFGALMDIGLSNEVHAIQAKAKINCRQCHGVMDSAVVENDLCTKCYYLGVVGLQGKDVPDTPEERNLSEGEDWNQYFNADKAIWDW
jgi:hypothetical protein